MRTILSPSLISFANKVAKIPGLKIILKPFYYRYKEKINNNRNSVFLKYGLSVLEEFDKIMTDYSIPYILTGGSMLGAVREKGFIKHDLDIDTAMWITSNPERIKFLLESHGFKLRHSFEVDNGLSGREDTYEKYDVSLDIFYIYESTEYGQYHCDFSPAGGLTTWEDSMKILGHVRCRRVEIPFSSEIIRVPFEHINVNIPANYDEWLSKRYGQDYMTPNPSWVNSEHPYIKVWGDKKPIYYTFHK